MMITDDDIGSVVLFGGISTLQANLNDTWVWDAPDISNAPFQSSGGIQQQPPPPNGCGVYANWADAVQGGQGGITFLGKITCDAATNPPNTLHVDFLQLQDAKQNGLSPNPAWNSGSPGPAYSVGNRFFYPTTAYGGNFQIKITATATRNDGEVWGPPVDKTLTCSPPYFKTQTCTRVLQFTYIPGGSGGVNY